VGGEGVAQGGSGGKQMETEGGHKGTEVRSEGTEELRRGAGQLRMLKVVVFFTCGWLAPIDFMGYAFRPDLHTGSGLKQHREVFVTRAILRTDGGEIVS